MTRLAGQVALVTGAASGIGAAILTRLADEGAVVAAVDLNDVEAAGGLSLQFDLADVDAIDAMVARVEAELGSIDVLVNCAALEGHAALADITPDYLSSVLAVNLMAPVLLARAVAPGMMARGYGRVVNITSTHAVRGHPEYLPYDVSKAALNQATRTLAIELGRTGILVNAIAPGFVHAGMAIVDGQNVFDSEWFQSVFMEHGGLPLGRGCAPEEVAALTAWLAGPENTYVTGQVVTIDGGATITL